MKKYRINVLAAAILVGALLVGCTAVNSNSTDTAATEAISLSMESTASSDVIGSADSSSKVSFK